MYRKLIKAIAINLIMAVILIAIGYYIAGISNFYDYLIGIWIGTSVYRMIEIFTEGVIE